ncbi:MAG: HAMP domain-containing protein [Tepidisphaera sp.]
MTFTLTLYLFAGLAAASSAVVAPMEQAQPGTTPEAAVTTPAAAPTQAPAAAPTRQPEQPGQAPAASAADSSTLTSDGKYKAPDLSIQQRAPFGPSAGRADSTPQVAAIVDASPLTTGLFSAGAGLALLLTGSLAFGLSRTTRADGSAARALTLGTKLSLGFGTLVTGTLAVSALNSRALMLVSTDISKANRYSDESQLVAELEADALESTLHVTDFYVSGSNETLAKYSDAMASFAQKYKVVAAALDDPQQASQLAQIGRDLDNYHATFLEVVSLADKREALIDDQMGPAVARVNELLEELARTAALDGDLSLANTVRELNLDIQGARVAFFKFLRSADPRMSEEAVALAREAMGDLDRIVSDVQHPRRQAWLKEATEATSFWMSRLEEAQTLQQRRNELVKGQLAGLAATIAEDAHKLVIAIDEAKDAALASTASTAARNEVLSTVIASVLSLLGAVIALGIARSIIRPVSGMIARISEIRASNDLTRQVDVASRDEIGRLGEAFNGMVQTLHNIIAEVKSGAVQIDAGGTQIASASQSMAQGASEQASSLQQISASLEEISGQTQQAAENARQANALAQESKKSADRGQQEMSQMNEAVNAIKQSSGEISKIIKVIDEIAFQTNLLALNAAVEAARAGEAGKGFAVVAEEVRNLAHRSAEAAKSTSSMIEESVKRSETGVQIAGRVGQSLEAITVSTNKVSALLAEIASAASEQATGVGQINQGVSQLDQVTQQNAGNSEELASSAEELSSQVASLNELVERFRVGDNGMRTTTVKAKPAAPAVNAHAASRHATPAAKPRSVSAGKTADRKAHAAEKVIPMGDEESLASF